MYTGSHKGSQTLQAVSTLKMSTPLSVAVFSFYLFIYLFYYYYYYYYYYYLLLLLLYSRVFTTGNLTLRTVWTVIPGCTLSISSNCVQRNRSTLSIAFPSHPVKRGDNNLEPDTGLTKRCVKDILGMIPLLNYCWMPCLNIRKKVA